MTELLLHICCGPCSIMTIRKLRQAGYEPLGWFHNPNIQPLSEYLRRREAAFACAEKLEITLEADDSWDLQDWLAAQLPHAQLPRRCENCCAMRLEQAAVQAKARGIGHFSTSLLYSRYQPHDFIRSQGELLAARYGLTFVYQDFRSYWQEGIDLSRAWGIYRQAWCGCVFSEAERYAKKLRRLQTGCKPVNPAA